MSSKDKYEGALNTLYVIEDYDRCVDEQESERLRKVVEAYVAELEARIAELEKDNEFLEKAFDKSRKRCDALKARIESAPNMWLRYQKAAFGLKLVSVAEDQEELDADDIDVVQQVYAVPVEEAK